MSQDEPSDEEILALARRYRPVDRITARFGDGANHLAYCLDDACVLKVARPGDDGGDGLPLRNEVAVLLALEDAVPRPELIGYNVEAPARWPHALLSLAPGACLRDLDEGWPHHERAMASLAKALRAVHALDPASLGLGPLYDPSSYASRLCTTTFERLRVAGPLTESRLASLHRRCQEALAVAARPGDTVIHADVRPVHLFVDPDAGELTSIIDFGDALVGSVELEFVFMWQRWWHVRDDVQLLYDAYFALPGAPRPAVAADDLRLLGAACRAGHPRAEAGAHAIPEVLSFA